MTNVDDARLRIMPMTIGVFARKRLNALAICGGALRDSGSPLRF